MTESVVLNKDTFAYLQQAKQILAQMTGKELQDNDVIDILVGGFVDNVNAHGHAHEGEEDGCCGGGCGCH